MTKTTGLSGKDGLKKETREEYSQIEKQVAIPRYEPNDYGTYHKEFANEDGVFRAACERAGVQPTKRQASKWRNGRGAAFSHR